MAGLSSTGFDRKRLTELVSDLKSSVQTEFGASANVNDDSVFGQLISGIFADRLDELWVAAEAIYNAWGIDTAEGTQLDNLVAMVGITRKAATRSGVTLVVTGDPGTVISGSGGFIAETATNKDRFRSVTGVTMTGANGVVGALLSVNTVSNATTYTVTLAGTNHSYLSDGDATEAEILAGLQAVIDAESAYTATVEGTQLRIDTVDQLSPVTLTVSTELTIDKLDANLLMESSNTGPIVATVGNLTSIITPVTGLDSITNPLAASLGSNEETDTELRVRALSSLQTGGNATADTVRSRLLEIEGVTAVTVIENESDATDANGRPPHSFEAIVTHNGLTATTDEIGQTLWDTKPLGIATHGDISLSAVDSIGNAQSVNYSVPVDKLIYARIEYTRYDEETFPAGGEDGIKTAFVNYGTDNLELSTDVIPQRFYGEIFGSVEGIETVTIYIAAINVGDPAPTFPGDYVTTAIDIATNEVARFDVSRVAVVDVTP